MPQLVELSLVTALLRSLGGRDVAARAQLSPNLEELTIDCANPRPAAQVVADIVTALPKLRRLRLLHLHRRG